MITRVVLCVCVLFTTYPDIPGTISVFAAEQRGEGEDSRLMEKEATESESGRQYKICEKCAAKLYRITDPLGIPAHPNAGKIEKEVEVLPGAPDTVLNNSKEELAQSVLEKDELAEIESGTGPGNAFQGGTDKE